MQGDKMEMTISELAAAETFEGLEKQEGKWVEIFPVNVDRAFGGFNSANSPYRLTAMSYTQVRIIDPLNNRHYMEFKKIHEIPHISSRNRNYPIGMNANT